jgi:hypothetical protein
MPTLAGLVVVDVVEVTAYHFWSHLFQIYFWEMAHGECFVCSIPLLFYQMFNTCALSFVLFNFCEQVISLS